MPRSYTVTFGDGTSHTYDNVPDNITNDQITQRAQQDFNKPVTGGSDNSNDQNTNAFGTPTALGNIPQSSASPGTDALAVGNMAWNAANNLLSSPIGHALEIGGAGYYGAKKLGGMVNQLSNSINPTPTPAPIEPTMNVPTAESVNRLLTPEEFLNVTKNNVLPQDIAARYASATASQPALVTVPPTPAVGTAENFMSRMAGLAMRYGSVAAKALTGPLATGATLALHSPELNANEDAQVQQMINNYNQNRARGLPY